MKYYTLTILAGSLLASTASALTTEDASTLLFIKQEEKLARDVYLALGDIWGNPAFYNIAKSEQQHMKAVDALIARFALEDTSPTEAGVFSIPALTELYETLMAKGLLSEKDALEVGVLVEETDIADLQAMIAQIEDEAVDQTLGNLLRASYKHLAAFSGQLDGSRKPSATQQRRSKPKSDSSSKGCGCQRP